MADFNALETLINAYIKKNGVQAITGNILNGVLRGMVSALGKGYTIVGVATPSTDPGTMTGPCAYYASTYGTYTNFGNIVVNDGEIAMLIYDEQTWHKEKMWRLDAEASIDANVGTPSVETSFEDELLTFRFHNIKGEQGDAAGFGTVTASVDSNIGTPGVSVQTSGPDTAKNMTFQFTNLKGETGVTSVVCTVDNTIGTPSCAVSLVGQELHLDFSGLKGAQGDTGVSADYPITIVNNLTTSDPTSALSAQMGVQLESEISQLELKLKGEDVPVGNFQRGYYSTYANSLPSSRSSTSTSTTYSDILNVSPGQKYTIYGEGLNNNYYRLYAFYDNTDARIELYSGSGNFRTTPLEVTVPANAVKMVINLGTYDSTTDKVLVPGSYIDFIQLQEDVAKNADDISKFAGQINDNEITRLRADRYSSVLCDWMQMVHAGSGMTSSDIISVSSSTASTITLASADAQKFANPGPAVVEFSDGTYKVVYFKAYSGTTVERDSFDTTDLTNATRVQNLHDTARGGYGVHLSAFGYLALAQFSAAEIARREAVKDSNLIAGVQMYGSTQDAGFTEIYDADGIKVASVENNIGQSGATGGGLMQTCKIVENSVNMAIGYGFLNTGFSIVASGTTKYANFNFDAIGEGFVEVQAALRTPSGYTTGNATVSVYADGVLVSSQSLKYVQTRHIFTGVKCSGKLTVKVSPDSATDICAVIYSINFYRANAHIKTPSLSGKRIAVLGDSWTQFPGSNAAIEGSSYNTTVTRPNGTQGDGYGYFPKELARVSGATVDNWGKSNMTADNWGLVMIDEVLEYAVYDYVFIEFFINDYITGVSVANWAENMAKIATRCKARGARPIFAVPCMTNGASYEPYGIRHEAMVRGLGLLP